MDVAGGTLPPPLNLESKEPEMRNFFIAAVLFTGAMVSGPLAAESARQPQYGDRSADKLYVYKSLEEGWMLAPHAHPSQDTRAMPTETKEHRYPQHHPENRWSIQQSPVDG